MSSLKLLRIDLERVRKEPLELDFDLPPEAFELGDDPEFAFAAPVRGRLVAKIIGHENVQLTGRVETRAQAVCVRCLEEIPVDVVAEVSLVFLPVDPDRERFQELGDQDKYSYTGDVVYPMEQLREELMVSLPSLPTCEAAGIEGCEERQRENAGGSPDGDPAERDPAENGAGGTTDSDSSSGSWKGEWAKLRERMKEGEERK